MCVRKFIEDKIGIQVIYLESTEMIPKLNSGQWKALALLFVDKRELTFFFDVIEGMSVQRPASSGLQTFLINNYISACTIIGYFCHWLYFLS
jgi:hypothetical protein